MHMCSTYYKQNVVIWNSGLVFMVDRHFPFYRRAICNLNTWWKLSSLEEGGAEAFKCFAKWFAALKPGHNCVIITQIVILQVYLSKVWIPLKKFTNCNPAAHHLKIICKSFCKFYCVNFFFWVKWGNITLGSLLMQLMALFLSLVHTESATASERLSLFTGHHLTL